MSSRLPTRYVVALWIVGLVAFMGAGAWLAFMTPLPLVWQYGAVAGALVGPLVIAAYCRVLAVRATRTARS